ncbi:MAG: cytochrome c oxidase accessory protein CcoG [Ignavibacteriales bacterium]
MAIANKPSTKKPATAEELGEFYADSSTIHPRKVKGTFRSLKWYVMAAVLAFWHLAPFIRWDRGPGAPNQAILADIAGRRAYFFFIEIWPQEIYYLTGLLLIAAIALFLMSAVAGRVWCGFLCWQTVYTDLFVLVERLVIGDRNKRIALDRKPWTAEKIVKRGVVNVAWAVISAACGTAFVLFFDDAPTMLKAILTGQESAATYTFIGIIGGCCYLLAGFAREQVCIYMCPYSRFQSAMVDEHSLVVSYEGWRGEPRAPLNRERNFEGRGHCIDCRMCVTSCPTGIDIREGIQLACIGCGLCIDACNTMMDKFKLPRGLISYDSIHNLERRGQGLGAETKLVRARTVLYTAIILLVGGLMTYSLAFRKTTDVNILHERNPLFVQLSDGSIRNGYVYKVLNMVRQDRSYTLKVAGIEGATLTVVGGARDVAEAELKVAGDDVGTFNIFVNAPEAKLQGKRTPVFFVLTEQGGEGRMVRSESLFAGPDK